MFILQILGFYNKKKKTPAFKFSFTQVLTLLRVQDQYLDKILPYKNLQLHTTIWVDLTNMILCGRSQTQKVQIEWFIYLKHKKRQHNAMMSEIKAVVPLGLREYLALFKLTLFPGFLVVLSGKELEKLNLCQLVWAGQARGAV